MVNRFKGPLALAAAVTIMIVGCGGGAPSSDSATTASSSAAAAAPPLASAPGSIAATTSPSEVAGSASPASLPSLPAIFSEHADPALEAQLPGVVSGTAMQRYSLTLTEILDAGGNRAAVDAFLQGIGKTEADGSFAAAFDPTDVVTGGVFAFKVGGADAATLLAGIVSVEKSDLGDGATAQPATVSGKSVTVVSIGSGVNDTEWILGHGDVVFVVHADSEAHAAAYLQALP